MEAIRDSGRVRMLGVSNVTFEQLQCLCDGARIQPSFVQNRCFATLSWDRQIREFCKTNGIIYQGFSLLTANREVLASPEIARIAASHGRTIPQLVFRFAIEVGMIPLTGDHQHRPFARGPGYLWVSIEARRNRADRGIGFQVKYSATFARINTGFQNRMRSVRSTEWVCQLRWANKKGTGRCP